VSDAQNEQLRQFVTKVLFDLLNIGWCIKDDGVEGMPDDPMDCEIGRILRKNSKMLQSDEWKEIRKQQLLKELEILGHDGGAQ
jgi:hypothetical protein